MLTACFPYSGDDWAWGSSIGLDRLSVFFKDYNGRYVGNLLVLVLTRLKIFDIIFMSFIILGIVYFCFKIINSSKKSSILMTIFLFLVIS